MNYKKLDFNTRITEAKALINNYPSKIPVIVNCRSNIPISKHKYLVPDELSCGKFLYALRKSFKMKASTALFMFINNTLPNPSTLLGHLYEKHKDDDLFLYVFISDENTFGTNKITTF